MEKHWTPARLRSAVEGQPEDSLVRRALAQTAATLLLMALAMAATYWLVSFVLDYEARLDCQSDGWATGEWTMGRVRCVEFHALRPSRR